MINDRYLVASLRLPLFATLRLLYFWGAFNGKRVTYRSTRRCIPAKLIWPKTGMFGCKYLISMTFLSLEILDYMMVFAIDVCHEM